MRRFWIMLLAIATALVIALPAGAVKPPRPPKPPTAAPIAVFIDAEPVWTHEADDIVKYHITLENKTNELIDDITIRFTAATPTVIVENVQVPANDNFGKGFWRTVSEYEEAAPCLKDVDPAAECGLIAKVEVLIDDVVITQTEMSTLLDPEPACGFDYQWIGDGEDAVLTGTRVEPVNDLCIWTLPEDGETTKTGVWEITLRPTLPDPETRKPLGAWMDVRDGVPGNWCTLAIDDSWGFSDRWKAPYPPDPTLRGHVYLPGDENLPVDPEDPEHPTLGLDNGMCISGGAGGDYFEVGNPKSFYLRADGDVPVTVTVKWVSEIPPPTPDETP